VNTPLRAASAATAWASSTKEGDGRCQEVAKNNLQTIGDPGNLTETELRGVMEFLIDKKRSGQFRKLWSGWEQGVEVMRSGEVWVMTGWEPIVKALQDQGIKAEYAIPKEGYEGWSIDLLMHSGAVKRGLGDSCHQFANWL
jgi:putative spermidine/putrescine transport system substrate-binding protein